MVSPRIENVSCSKVRFQPGDKVLVRTYSNLRAEQIQRLKRTIENWAGGGVEVFIYNALEMEVTVDNAVPMEKPRKL